MDTRRRLRMFPPWAFRRPMAYGHKELDLDGRTILEDTRDACICRARSMRPRRNDGRPAGVGTVRLVEQDSQPRPGSNAAQDVAE